MRGIHREAETRNRDKSRPWRALRDSFSILIELRGRLGLPSKNRPDARSGPT